MDPKKVKIPELKDLNADTITKNTIAINSNNPDVRMKFLLERLVTHLHDYARETRLSHNEWMAAIEFLTATGQICSSEFILLSDILGLSLLVDSIDHPKPSHSTEGTVLGPFHTHEAEDMKHGDSISADPEGKSCLVACTLRDTAGKPIEGCKIDIWETDSSGHYDVQHAGYDGPDGRCVMRSDKNGDFWFKAIVPVSYPIPHDGPVGQLLIKLRRHPWRPAHMHFMFEKEGYDHLITSLYMRGDPYETSDAVFGVKNSLVIDVGKVDKSMAEKYGVKEGSALISYDFVLVSDKEADELRDQKSMEALHGLGMKCKIINGLPVPEVD